MKIAEEYTIDHMRMVGCSEKVINGEVNEADKEHRKQATEFFRAMLLDAYKQGMTDSAKLVTKYECNDFFPDGISKAILTARDNKTTI